MEEYIQFSAKTKNEAITKACIELETSSDKLEIQVISEGSSGFFGFGSKPAIIKARRIQDLPEEEENVVDFSSAVNLDTVRDERRRKPQKYAQKKEHKAATENKSQTRSEFRQENKSEKTSPDKPLKEKSSVEKTVTEKTSAEKPAEVKASEEKTREEKKDINGRTERDRQTKEKPVREKYSRNYREKGQRERNYRDKAPREKLSEEEQENREKLTRQNRPIEILTDPQEIKEAEDRAKTFLHDVFASMDLGEVEITSTYNTTDGSLDVNFEGEDMGILIGKRGQTLDSLQYLTSLVVNKGESNYIRVKLDTEDYRRRRKETLENLSRGIAYKVKKTRKPVVLEPMNPYERRIIHSALQGNRYVETFSEGEEPYRHVVVRLKRNSYSGYRNNRGSRGTHEGSYNNDRISENADTDANTSEE